MVGCEDVRQGCTGYIGQGMLQEGIEGSRLSGAGGVLGLGMGEKGFQTAAESEGAEGKCSVGQ